MLLVELCRVSELGLLQREIRPLLQRSSFTQLYQPELRNCVKVGVAVLGSPPLTVLVVSVDVKQH